MSSTSKHFAEGSLIADSRDVANSLMVITSGQVRLELHMDSAEADEENKKPMEKPCSTYLDEGKYHWCEGQNAFSHILTLSINSTELFHIHVPCF